MCMFALFVPTHTTKTALMKVMQNVSDVIGGKTEKLTPNVSPMMTNLSSFESSPNPNHTIFVYPSKTVVIDNCEVAVEIALMK